jgi:hypothetical protein
MTVRVERSASTGLRQEEKRNAPRPMTISKLSHSPVPLCWNAASHVSFEMGGREWRAEKRSFGEERREVIAAFTATCRAVESRGCQHSVKEVMNSKRTLIQVGLTGQNFKGDEEEEPAGEQRESRCFAEGVGEESIGPSKGVAGLSSKQGASETREEMVQAGEFEGEAPFGL